MINDKNLLNEELNRLKEMMGINEEKADRCLRIARRKYDKPSAYRSGAIVRCRQGKIWKDLKEAGELDDFTLNEDEELITMAHEAITREKGKEYAPNVHELQDWIDNITFKSKDEYLKEHDYEIDLSNGSGTKYKLQESNERFQNTALDNLNDVGDFNKLRDIDKLALLGGTNDSKLKGLNFTNIFKENGGTFGKFEIKVRVKDLKDQPVKHKFSEQMAGAEGYLFPYINYTENGEGYVTVRFDEFEHDSTNYGGGNYKELPIMLKNIYPIDYDEIKSDFVKHQNQVDSERKRFRDDFGLEDEMFEAKKTDYSKEKKDGLHGWFSRRGGGGSKGWVDCNTCRTVDGKKKCKACGRQKGEKRAKYPSCRPTPASCGTPGKGKKWGKTKNESVNEISDKMYDDIKTNHQHSRIVMTKDDVIEFKPTPIEKQHIDAKPVGLWYSIGDSWISWVKNNAPKWEGDNVFKLELDESKILKITNYDEMIEFTKKYGEHSDFTINMGERYMMINWGKVASDYGGIEITPHIWKGKTLMWYYSWDVASGCIWDNGVITNLTKLTDESSPDNINEAETKKKHRVSLLFIVIDNQVLLFKRSSKETTNPGKYGMLGGGIEKGETPEEALKREIEEEAGVTLTSFKPLKKYDYDGVELNVFYTNTFPVDAIKLDKKEHTSYEFFTLDDVMNMGEKEMIQSNKEIANDYNNKVNKNKQLEEQISRMKTVIAQGMKY